MFRSIKVHAGFSRVLTEDEKRLQVVYGRIDQVKEYFDKYGKYPSSRSGSFGVWLNNIRQAKKGKKRKRKDRWDNRYLAYAIRIGLPNMFEVKDLIKINYRLDQIKEYYDKHGKIPAQRSGSLGVWLANMIQTKKGRGNGIWDNEYLVYAISIGLPKDIFENEDRLKVVYDRLDKIKEYYDKHGNYPMQKSGSIGKWLSNMRQAKKGNSTTIWDNNYLVYAISIGLPKDMFDCKKGK